MLGARYVDGNWMDLMNERVSVMVGDGRGSIRSFLVSYQLRNDILKIMHYCTFKNISKTLPRVFLLLASHL